MIEIDAASHARAYPSATVASTPHDGQAKYTSKEGITATYTVEYRKACPSVDSVVHLNHGNRASEVRSDSISKGDFKWPHHPE